MTDLAPPAADSVEALLLPLWRRRWLVLLAGLCGLAAAIAALHVIPPRWSAYLQLVPTEQSGAQVSRNISGLASLAGINLPRGETSQFAFALETLRGRDVAAVIAADQPLLRRLFPGVWDARAGQWREPTGPLEGVRAGVRRVLAMPARAWQPPDAVAVQKLLEKQLVVKEDPKRNIATVILELDDPVLAGDLLAALYRATDANLRDRMDRRTSAYIAYIDAKLRSVTLAEHREVLAAALADQERQLMMARAGQPFAADALGGISVSDRPTAPNTLLILGAGLAAGLAAGGALAFGLDWRRARRLRTAAAA